MSRGEVEFQCCFCGLGIEAVVPDPASLLYITCFGGASETRQHQEMFCHTNCLREGLHSSVKLYAAFLAKYDHELS